MDALISIHPVFVDQILAGTKTVEFRKQIFKQPIANVQIYSTSPVKRIVASFPYSGFDTGTPAEIWRKYKHCGGIDEHSFFAYFSKSSFAYAIHITDLIPLQVPKTIDFPAPQSYKYVR